MMVIMMMMTTMMMIRWNVGIMYSPHVQSRTDTHCIMAAPDWREIADDGDLIANEIVRRAIGH